jgi:hypothetical protein
MKLGVGLPNTLAHQTDRTLMLEWARLADDASDVLIGFPEISGLNQVDQLAEHVLPAYV